MTAIANALRAVGEKTLYEISIAPDYLFAQYLSFFVSE